MNNKMYYNGTHAYYGNNHYNSPQIQMGGIQNHLRSPNAQQIVHPQQPQQIQMGIIINNHFHNHRRMLTTEMAKDVDLPEDTPLEDGSEGNLNTFKLRQNWAYPNTSGSKRKEPANIQTIGAIEEHDEEDGETEDDTGPNVINPHSSAVGYHHGSIALPQQAQTPVTPYDYDPEKETETDTEEEMYNEDGYNDNDQYGHGQKQR